MSRGDAVAVTSSAGAHPATRSCRHRCPGRGQVVGRPLARDAVRAGGIIEGDLLWKMVVAGSVLDAMIRFDEWVAVTPRIGLWIDSSDLTVDFARNATADPVRYRHAPDHFGTSASAPRSIKRQPGFTPPAAASAGRRPERRSSWKADGRPAADVRREHGRPAEHMEAAVGLFDKAKDLISGNKDQVKDGIDKVAGLADDKTAGKHSDKIGNVADKAKGAIDKLQGA